METVSYQQVPFQRKRSSLNRTCRCAGCCPSFRQPPNRHQWQCTNYKKPCIEVKTVQTTPSEKSTKSEATLWEKRLVSTTQNIRRWLFLLLGPPTFSPTFNPVRWKYLVLYINHQSMPTKTIRQFMVGTYQGRRRFNLRIWFLVQNKSEKGFRPLQILNLKRKS